MRSGSWSRVEESGKSGGLGIGHQDTTGLVGLQGYCGAVTNF